MPGPTLHTHYHWRCPHLVLLIVLSAIVACSSPHRTNDGIERRNFIDGLGRQVAILPNPQRIISLAPNLTETLFALGLGNRIVGVTSFCDFPAAAQTKEKVGDTMRPNLERIIALKPDLVLISTASQLESLMRHLDQLKVPVYVTDPRTVTEVVASIRALGEITGATERAAAITSEMERRINAVRQRAQGLPKPRVLYVIQNGPLITAGRNTYINDLIILAGGQSISGEEATDYPQFSRETVIARAPEVIISSESHGRSLVDLDALRRDFAVTPAVRQNRIELVTTDLIDRPGPRIIDGLEQMMRALHPESSRQ
jgi:iron complex transport system substrate-binding protein